jgi:uncharacterized protein with FMN-binding domain
MRKTITTLLTAGVMAIPVANATAAVTKTKVVIRSFSGSTVQVHDFGPLQLTITVRKTTTTIGSKKKVTRRITAISVPTYPNHSGRSQFINQNAIPILRSEALQAQSASIDMVSGATYTSEAFAQSLQAAILKAKRA